MTIETKYSVGNKVICKVDASFWASVIQSVTTRLGIDGVQHINYEAAAKLVYAPESKVKSEIRTVYATEENLIDWHKEYTEREKNLPQQPDAGEGEK